LYEEKRDHEQLQETWQMANDQFLESQTLMMMDLRRMEGVLSTEQQRQIAGNTVILFERNVLLQSFKILLRSTVIYVNDILLLEIVVFFTSNCL